MATESAGPPKLANDLRNTRNSDWPGNRPPQLSAEIVRGGEKRLVSQQTTSLENVPAAVETVIPTVVVHDTWEKPARHDGASRCVSNLDRPCEHVPNVSKSSTGDRRVADTSQSRLPGNPISIDPPGRSKFGEGDDNRMSGKLNKRG
jgi:hypothetical protein